MSRASFAPRLSCAGLLALSLVALGCGSAKPASLSGTVTFNGRPIAGGTLTLMGPDNKAASCEIGSDGSYSIDSITSGKVLVAVSSPNPEQSAPTTERTVRTGRGPMKKNAAPPKADPNWFAIPEKFANPDTSGVSIEVKPGAQTMTIDIREQ